ncbi:MAG: transposase [Deltaproteobacteria bacterium]|nr:transposase [Deltaproteobacteria bacterium]
MVRCYRPDWVHEVTLCTIDRRWWFEADNVGVRRAILGALAAAQRRTRVRVHAFVFMSNHYHGLFSADYPEQFSMFLQLFHAAVARIVNRRWQRSGRVWSGRAVVIPVAPDEESQLQRLEYLLAQNGKAGIGAHPSAWPGASSTPWLLDGTPLVGECLDQTAVALAGRNGRSPGDLAAYTEELAVEMAPLPCFVGRPEAEWRAQIQQLAQGVAERFGASSADSAAEVAEEAVRAAAACSNMASGPLDGVPSDLDEAAERVRISKPPPRKAIKRVHAARSDVRAQLEEELDAFEEAYRLSAAALRAESAKLAAGLPAQAVRFPMWSFPARATPWPRWPDLL